MTDVLYLAWRYLAYHRVKTAVLVAAVAIIVYLPGGLCEVALGLWLARGVFVIFANR